MATACTKTRELWRLTGEGSEIRNNGITVQGVSDSTVENVTHRALPFRRPGDHARRAAADRARLGGL